MVLLNLNLLEAGKITSLEDSPPISLSSVSEVFLTAECRHTRRAKKPIRIHVRASYNGINYDTSDLFSFDNDFKAGGIARKTLKLDKKVPFIKVLIENPEGAQAVSDVKVTATLSGH